MKGFNKKAMMTMHYHHGLLTQIKYLNVYKNKDAYKTIKIRL